MKLVKVENTLYSKYEELLLKRDQLKKEANQIWIAYIREFGDLMTKLLQQQISCVEKKKIIAYCQKQLNRGYKIDIVELDQYIQEYMKNYYDQLEEMINDHEASKKSELISEDKIKKIKSIYRKLAKKIHPDINPEVYKYDKIQNLRYQIQIAYQSNDYEGMLELEVLVNKVLEELQGKVFEIHIPDIEDKIKKLEQEIEEIVSTDPYRYKFLLVDQESIDLKKKELEDEIEIYKDYESKLDAIVESFNIRKVVS